MLHIDLSIKKKKKLPLKIQTTACSHICKTLVGEGKKKQKKTWKSGNLPVASGKHHTSV